VKLPLSLKIAYLTPETLGFDRIANCIGAMKLFPGQPLLVIDSGTCITLNWVSADGVFRGGNISPGVEMRFKSLHHYTAKLPCLAPAENYGEVGQTTETAIVNGVMRGVFFEVQSYITQFCREEPDAVVVMTGGNAHFWESSFVEKCFFCKELGLIGLNEVLEKCKKE
jgi:type III pantothenate kinase